MEKSLDKLGTVLAMTNNINLQMLNKLEAQQKRQTDIIRYSIIALGMAFLVVGFTVYISFRSIDRLTEQVEQNREMIMEVLQYGRESQNSEADPG